MSDKLGSEQRPLRVAIIGSGPSGFYAASALVKKELKVQVDMFDRLPAPFGLVRYGVAPDHAKIKNVVQIYKKIMGNDNVNFYGNVTIGEDIKVSELKTFYDAIIFTCGAETDRKLGIPGEDLTGSHTATEFVGWYNGHPDFRDCEFDLSCEVAVIIGQGNVAMDVARILCKTVNELKITDIAQHALDALAESKIKEIHLIGRRGPVQAAFTPTEIREVGHLEDCYPTINPKYLNSINEASKAELKKPGNITRKKNWEILQTYAASEVPGKSKKLVIHFYKSPAELKGKDKLEKIVLERNRMTGEPGKQKARGTGETNELPCGILFRSIGYSGIPIDGIPFDERNGVFSNRDGRITDNENIIPGMYCAGWIKRGPSGVVGTNKPDSIATVDNLITDLDKLQPCATPDTKAVLDLLANKNVKVINYEDWKKIDALEIERGQKIGKPREKFVTAEEMFVALKK